MSCTSRDYKLSDGFMGLYYFSKGVQDNICDINNQFKTIIGGNKINKRKIKTRKIKTRKYRQYTNAKKSKIYKKNNTKYRYN